MEGRYEEVLAFLTEKVYPAQYSKTKCQTLRRYSSKFSVSGGVLYYGRRKAVKTQDECRALFEEFHRNTSGGHSGIFKTRSALCAEYYWPGMTVDVEKWVSECDQCQRVEKPLAHGNCTEVKQHKRPLEEDSLGTSSPSKRPRREAEERFLPGTTDSSNHDERVQAMFLTPDPSALDRHTENSFSYVHQVEGDMYESKNSRGENDHFLAESINMEEKRKSRLSKPQMSAQGPQQLNTVGPGQAIQPLNELVPMSSLPNQLMHQMHCPQGIGQLNPVTLQNRQMMRSPRPAPAVTHPPQTGGAIVPAMGGLPQTPAMMEGHASNMEGQMPNQNPFMNQALFPDSAGGVNVNPNLTLQSGQTEETKPEESSTNSTTASSQSAQSRRKIFTLEELRQALKQTLEALYREDPESLLFQQPVKQHKRLLEEDSLGTSSPSKRPRREADDSDPSFQPGTTDSSIHDEGVQAMFLTPDPAAQDRHTENSFSYVHQVEGDMYESKNSRGENDHFLAESINMEEKRKSRLSKPQMSAQGPQQHNTVGPGQAIQPQDGPVPMSSLPNQFMGQMQVPQGIGQLNPVTLQNRQMMRSPRPAPAVTHPPQTGGAIVPAMGGLPQTPAMMEGHASNMEGQMPNQNPFMNQALFPDYAGGVNVNPNLTLQSGQTEETKPEESSTNSTTASSQSAQSRRKIFTLEELRQALKQTLEALYREDPESLLFQQPNPVDLSTIERKLNTGKYQEPWQFIDDIWMMFNNLWLNNRKTSRVYKCCSKLSVVFTNEIDPVMKGLGYCCGRKYEFSPQTLWCYGKQLCTISRNSTYYSYQNRYHFCENCFNNIQGDSVTLEDDPTQPHTVISKEQFEKKKNDTLDPEPFVECKDCGRKMHQICVLHHDVICPSGFICDHCLKRSGKTRKQNKYSAKNLKNTRLGLFIEDRVNKYLKQNDPEAGEVFVRVVSSSDKTVKVKAGMKTRFVDSGEMAESFPYRTKALFVFQKFDGVDVCFFGMYVQEYGSDCPFPNTRRVYLSYLDSVHFFKPRMLRSAIYHKILISYLEYVKKLGYVTGHIWSCPPRKGDDYIFHRHPPDQKIPTPKILQEWYQRMLDKASDQGIIHDYKDIFTQATEDQLTSAYELPCFEGDILPSLVEESIKELEQEEEKRKKENTASSETTEGTQADSKCLFQKLYAKMKKHREVFVIRLHADVVIDTLSPITDPDPVLTCDLTDNRDAFLTWASDKHWEFSSLRRCKWSTMCMLLELHNQGQEQSVYTCNECKHHVETRWHCTVCEDLELCINCFNSKGHEHQMMKRGLGLDADSTQSSEASTSPQQRQHLGILEHACQCRNASCPLPSCQKMKREVQHTKDCKNKANGGCLVCKQLHALCSHHAKQCEENKCPVPFCLRIKHKLRQQQIQQSRQMKAVMPPSNYNQDPAAPEESAMHP